MAIDEADQSDAGQFEGVEDTDPPDGSSEGGPTSDSDVRVGRYTWREFMEEHGYEGQVSDLYANVRQRQQARQEEELGLESSDEAPPPVPEGEDWGTVEFDPTEFLGFHPDDLADRIRDPLAPNAKLLHNEFLEYVDPDTTPVVKDVWTWEHFKWEYYYDENGDRPRAADGSIDRFDAEEFLGFDPAHTENELSRAEDVATELKDLVDERTVNVNEEIDEDAFFSTADGHTTVTNRYDLEKAVPFKKKRYFREKERYWVNKPYAFVIVFHSEKENEVKYYVVEPYLTEIEDGVREFLTGKLRNAIKYSDENLTIDDDEESRRSVIEQETRKLLKRYDLFDAPSSAGGSKGLVQQFREMLGESEPMAEFEGGLDGDIETDRLEGPVRAVRFGVDADLSEVVVARVRGRDAQRGDVAGRVVREQDGARVRAGVVVGVSGETKVAESGRRDVSPVRDGRGFEVGHRVGSDACPPPKRCPRLVRVDASGTGRGVRAVSASRARRSASDTNAARTEPRAVGRGSLFVLFERRDVGREVRGRGDADDVVVVGHDRDVVDPMFEQSLGDVGHDVLGARRHDVRRHELGDRRLVLWLALRDDADEVGRRQDPRESSLLVDDDNGANLLFEHHLRGLLHGGLRRDGCRSGRHQACDEDVFHVFVIGRPRVKCYRTGSDRAVSRPQTFFK